MRLLLVNDFVCFQVLLFMLRFPCIKFRYATFEIDVIKHHVLRSVLSWRAIYVLAIFDAIFSFLSLSGCFFYRYPLRSKIKVSFVIIFLLVVIIMFTRFMFHQYPQFMFCILASISLHKPFVSFAFSSNHITM